MKTQKNKAITLIALVVTIVIMLILAGISLNLLFGENGIINKAKMGKTKFLGEEAREEVEREVNVVVQDMISKKEQATLYDFWYMYNGNIYSPQYTEEFSIYLFTDEVAAKFKPRATKNAAYSQNVDYKRAVVFQNDFTILVDDKLNVSLGAIPTSEIITEENIEEFEDTMLSSNGESSLPSSIKTTLQEKAQEYNASISPSYSLTVTSSNPEFGTVSITNGQFKPNTEVTLTATPNSGYKLVGWSDGENVVSTESTYTFVMPSEPYSLNAMFIQNSTNVGEVIATGNSTFVVVRQNKSWKDAKAYAESLGARLAIIDSQEKQDLIYEQVKTESYVWIGLTDEAEEGVWRFVDGRLASDYFTYWYSGEPNNTNGNEHYACIWIPNRNGMWNDFPNNESFPFVIEYVN